MPLEDRCSYGLLRRGERVRGDVGVSDGGWCCNAPGALCCRERGRPECLRQL